MASVFTAVSRMFDDILQHVELLGEHCLRVVVLYLKILEVYVHTFHVHLHRHSVVEECFGYVFQLFQAGYVGFHDVDLLNSALCEIVHTAYLFDEVVARFVI